MKYYFYALVLVCIGCTAIQPVKSTQSTQPTTSNITNSPEQLSKTKTNILYYYVSPDTKAQFIGIVSGTFYWESGCIYLLKKRDDRIVKLTALFPDLPEGSVSWNEEEKVLTLMNPHPTPQYFEFKMGDIIMTNGYYGSFNLDSPDLDENKIKCATKDGFASIGTYDIRKYIKD